MQSPCSCDCLVCTRFEPSSCMSPPSPIWLIFRKFVSSPAVRFGLLFPRGGRKAVGLVTAPHPRGKREIKPPPNPAPPLQRGARRRSCCPGRARTGQCMACAPRSGLGVGVTGALGVSAAPPCALGELFHCPHPQGSQGRRLCPCLFNPADGYSVSTLGIGWRRLFCPPLVGKHLPNAQLARVCFFFSFLIRVSPVK